MSQLTFKWPARPSYAPQDFIISAANAEAEHFLGAWPDGHSHVALLSGPEACGKTHLALSWATRTQAAIINASAVGTANSSSLWQEATHAVLEDIHGIADEAALFHVLRHAEAHGFFLLLTARAAARHLPFTLADLRSRLLALPAAAIQPPDEELLKGFLYKCFADRQLRVSKEAMEYLLKRLERSFAAGHKIVEAIEDRALESGRQVSVPLVKSLIG